MDVFGTTGSVRLFGEDGDYSEGGEVLGRRQGVTNDKLGILARIIHERDNGAFHWYSDSVKSPESWRCPAWTSLPQMS